MSVTYEQVQAAYLDNADFRAEASTAKAQAFITACTRLLAFPQASGRNSASVQYNLAQIEKQLNDARRWLAQQGSSAATVSHPNFEGFRD